jgi:hypothetical protein
MTNTFTLVNEDYRKKMTENVNGITVIIDDNNNTVEILFGKQYTESPIGKYYQCRHEREDIKQCIYCSNTCCEMCEEDGGCVEHSQYKYPDGMIIIGEPKRCIYERALFFADVLKMDVVVKPLPC